MKFIKKFNENFDDENIKDLVKNDPDLELPYLKGELGEETKNWLKLKIDGDLKRMYQKLTFRFPILLRFETESDDDVISNFALSKDHKYYGQLSYATAGGSYYVYIIFRDAESDNFVIKENFKFNNIDEVYDKVNNFLDMCVHYKIISKKQKFVPEDN
jgi:hypothetical protein